MSYDHLAESLRLIEHGPPAQTPHRLSRRVRFVPLTVDVVGDLAVTQFVRRGVSGAPEIEGQTLQRLRDGWRLLGGSGGGGPGNPLADRPTAAELGNLIRGHGGGFSSVGRNGRRSIRRPSRRLGHGEYRMAREVATVVVLRHGVCWRWLAAGAEPHWVVGRGWTSGRRTARGLSAVVRRRFGGRAIAVPRHGTVVVAWASRRPPRLVALDADGRPLTVVPAQRRWPPGHRPPLRYRTQRYWFLRFPWLERVLPRRYRPGPVSAVSVLRATSSKADGDEGRDKA